MKTLSNISNKVSLMLIIGIPVIGILVMTIYYYYVTSNGIMLPSKNQGILITPPKLITEIKISRMDGSDYQWLQKEKKWTILVVGRENCDESCQQKLYHLKQMHTALGSNSVRVETAYLNLDGRLTSSTVEFLEKEHKKLKILGVDNSETLAWFSMQEPKLDIETAGNFYLVDPAGWVMMYYTKDHEYKAIIKDVKFLLNNS